MLYVALLALIATVATAAPILDMFAEPCTGSGNFKADMVGKCYGGGATVLTLTETAVLKVVSYDDSTHTGTMRVDLEGAQTAHCGPATFKKSALDGQINSDLSSCGKLHKALASAQYCTDQDTMCAAERDARPTVHLALPARNTPCRVMLIGFIPLAPQPSSCEDSRPPQSAGS